MAPPGYAGEGSWQPAAFGIDYHLSAVKCISSWHRCRTLGHGSVPESVHSPQFGSCTECELLGLYHSAPCLLMSPKKPVRCETVFTYKPAENAPPSNCVLQNHTRIAYGGSSKTLCGPKYVTTTKVSMPSSEELVPFSSGSYDNQHLRCWLPGVRYVRNQIASPGP